MKWAGRRGSGNVEDRRGMSAGRMVVGGGLGNHRVLIVVATLFGVDPRQIINQVSTPQTEESAPVDPHQEELKHFVSVILADTEDIWGQVFRNRDRPIRSRGWSYIPARSNPLADSRPRPRVRSTARPTRRLYMDFVLLRRAAVALRRARRLRHRLRGRARSGPPRAEPDGDDRQGHAMQGQVSETEYNQMSVRLELQADFLAGVWAHYAQNTLDVVEPGDFDEAIAAAGRSATIASRRKRAAPSSPTRSRTALRRSVSRGSAAATKPATSRRATLSASTTGICNYRGGSHSRPNGSLFDSVTRQAKSAFSRARESTAADPGMCARSISLPSRATGPTWSIPARLPARSPDAGGGLDDGVADFNRTVVVGGTGEAAVARSGSGDHSGATARNTTWSTLRGRDAHACSPAPSAWRLRRSTEAASREERPRRDATQTDRDRTARLLASRTRPPRESVEKSKRRFVDSATWSPASGSNARVRF